MLTPTQQLHEQLTQAHAEALAAGLAYIRANDGHVSLWQHSRAQAMADALRLLEDADPDAAGGTADVIIDGQLVETRDRRTGIRSYYSEGEGT